ncbi:MAG: serine/threonine protein kinase [Gemmataceae bacterium]|nr:serine/threonine protein kinase [Gemmataceae bacterium]
MPASTPSPVPPLTPPTVAGSPTHSFDAGGTKPFHGEEPAPDALPRLPGYEVLEEIGRGGMGVVYRALDVRLERIVALKVMRHGADQRMLLRFANEAKAMARLDHPHIVPILGGGEHRGAPYLAMKHLPGGTLASRRLASGCEPRWVAVLMEKVARAVDYLHSRHLLHRDLKPSNILLDEAGEPHVADFGIAKLLRGGEMTPSGAVLGTLWYMSPEQVRGDLLRLGRASDVWALGVILHELVAGQRPFLGDELRVASAIVSDPPPPLPPEQSRGLQPIISKCLEKRPERRYATARQLADDLKAWLEGLPPRPRNRRATMAACLSALSLGGLTALVGGEAKPGPEPPKRSLLREDGWPASMAWMSGQEKTRLAGIPSEKALSITAESSCLLDLASAPGWLAYRLVAEVRYSEGPTGSAGIYIGRTLEPDRWGGGHVFLRLALRDTAEQGGFVLLEISRRQAKGGAGSNRAVLMPAAAFPPDMLPGPRPWQRLELAVTPKEVRASWNGKLLASKPVAEIREEAATRLGLPAWNPLGPGGLGVCVNDAEAAFRNVALAEIR